MEINILSTGTPLQNKDEFCCIFCGGFTSIAAIGSSRKIHGCTYKASGSDLVQTEEMLPHN